MFDTMTLTKIVGGFCGSLLVFLLGGWAAEAIYHVGGGHGDEHAQAYTIPVEESGGGEAEEEEGPAFEEVFASADAGAGERVFGKCRACHNIDGSNATGPHLDGVVDREVGAVAGFNYSGALSENFDVWTPENLSAFLQNPRGTASGTTMSFAGLSSIEERANVIAYLQSVGG